MTNSLALAAEYAIVCGGTFEFDADSLLRFVEALRGQPYVYEITFADVPDLIYANAVQPEDLMKPNTPLYK